MVPRSIFIGGSFCRSWLRLDPSNPNFCQALGLQNPPKPDSTALNPPKPQMQDILDEASLVGGTIRAEKEDAVSHASCTTNAIFP
jgi:hypothetical protein